MRRPIFNRDYCLAYPLAWDSPRPSIRCCGCLTDFSHRGIYLSLLYWYKEPMHKSHRKFFKLSVKYIPADGLTTGELAKYEAGMAPPIPTDPLSIYPNTCICFKSTFLHIIDPQHLFMTYIGPLKNPFNLTKHITVTNIFTRPVAFRILLTAQKVEVSHLGIRRVVCSNS